ncbi:LysR family transcriptional regulator [Hyphomonadaceae bacterium BL14]|nr:LysR family transcriptional regulator [Hyphomonadaceae bacterium BL14]
MDVREARLLTACAGAGTITAAAQALNVSQPAASRTLAQIEARLGGAVFDRTGRRLVLTALGAAILPRAQALVQQSADLIAQARAWRSGEDGALTVGAGPAVAFYLLPAALAAYYGAGRQVRLRVQAGASDQLIDAVRSGLLDMAVCDSEPAEGDRALEITGLPGVAIASAVRPGHPALAGAPLADFPVASATPPARMRRASWPWPSTDANLVSDDYALLAQVCAVSDHVLVAPEPVLARLVAQGTLCLASAPFDRLVVHPGVITRAGAPDSAARDALRRAVIHAAAV